jgi:menaquinone-dependent protoporphyrinogen oxidase
MNAGENKMDKKILIAYATKYGATGEIAEKISLVLRKTGFGTDVLAVKNVKDLSPYKAVVLGSAVYIGKWRKDAAAFLKTNEAALAEKPVWLFSSGPTGKETPDELLKGWRFPKALQPVADRIQPRDMAIFHGDVNIEKLSGVEKWMVKNVKAQSGDFRDWGAITSWAESIADDLKKAS